jgi:peptidoglycan/LPS O-acetylase OafA/YrhL
MFRVATLQRVVLVLLGLSCATVVGFIIVIFGNLQKGIILHEIAGLVLLILLAGALWAAFKLRRIDARPVVRVCLALASLIVAGVLGAALASGATTGVPAYLPLVPFALLLVSAIDGLRVTRNLPISAAQSPV